MPTATVVAQAPKRVSQKCKPAPPAPIPLQADVNYSAGQAAQAVTVSPATIWRAIYGGHLRTYRIGSRVVISGAQLIAWRDAGGKTTQK